MQRQEQRRTCRLGKLPGASHSVGIPPVSPESIGKYPRGPVMIIWTSCGKLTFPPHVGGSDPSHIPFSRSRDWSAGKEALPDGATPHCSGRLLRSAVLFLNARSLSCGVTRAAGKPSVSNVLCTSNSAKAGK